MAIQNTRIQLRRGTAAALAAVNEVLLAGELGIETDTGKYKIGNGSTQWNSLAYSGQSFPTGESVYVLKNGAYTPANVVDMSGTWSPSINGQDIVLAVDEDMTPYQLTGTNTEISALLNASCTSTSRTSTNLTTDLMTTLALRLGAKRTQTSSSTARRYPLQGHAHQSSATGAYIHTLAGLWGLTRLASGT